MVHHNQPEYNYKVQIDWMSFTWPIEWPEGKVSTIQRYRAILGRLERFEPYFHGLVWEPANGRFPYQGSFKSDQGIRCYFHIDREHVLIEISGQGCRYLASRGDLSGLLAHVVTRLTRIDLALDVECDYRPDDVVPPEKNGRFRARTTITSDTGDTIYIGSQKSDRYLRVYRYNFPHPRHKYLRFEFVFRRDLATHVAWDVIEHDLKPTIRDAGATFGIEHPCFVLTGGQPIPGYTPERGAATTVRWFFAQVVPALRRLMEDNIIDSDEIIAAIMGPDDLQAGTDDRPSPEE